ncbi:HAMP domain-containing histidine kinase [Scytonema hofmannii]|uniref:HAMP domain-containing histidine kinase n=1 Tax=Scytonema hofmannii TaxID=34078 RepID=UPI00034D6E27|nr:HAMP domain-containing histidine kinase [Scytonema hofmannii]
MPRLTQKLHEVFLAIARQIIVDKHGGAIAVNSNLCEGTEFAIELSVKANH